MKDSKIEDEKGAGLLSSKCCRISKYRSSKETSLENSLLSTVIIISNPSRLICGYDCRSLVRYIQLLALFFDGNHVYACGTIYYPR